MVFDSVTFLFRFFPIFMTAYFLIPGKGKNLLLCLGSMLVCAWGDPGSLVLLLGSILFHYIMGMLLDNLRGKTAGKVVLLVALCLDICGLSVGVGRSAVALSIWAIHGISYCLDVYSGAAESFLNPVHLAVYLSFFPVWMAGPILSYREMEPQIRNRSVKAKDVKDGLKRICFGLTKKVFLGDRFGALWGEVLHRGAEQMSAGTAWLGAVAFLFWLFFTFSGYADIAVGLSRMLGFSVPENFLYPFQSVSVSDFCNRFLRSVTAFLRQILVQSLDLEHKNVLLKGIFILLAGGIAGLLLDRGLSAVVCGVFIALFFLLEKIGLGKLLQGLSKPVGMLYTMVVVLVAGVILGLGDLSLLLPYGKSLIGLRGVLDRQFFFLGEQYLVYLALGSIVASAIPELLVEKLRASKSGFGMALYRLGEIVLPAACLLWTMIWAFGTGYPEFAFSF